jgi:hypothetical protein
MLFLPLGGGGFSANAQSIDTISFVHERPASQLLLIFDVIASTNQPFTIDWGDGTIEAMMKAGSGWTVVCFLYHTYSVAGTYTVTIIGSPTCTFSRLVFSYEITPYTTFPTCVDVSKAMYGSKSEPLRFSFDFIGNPKPSQVKEWQLTFYGETTFTAY